MESVSDNLIDFQPHWNRLPAELSLAVRKKQKVKSAEDMKMKIKSIKEEGEEQEVYKIMT